MDTLARLDVLGVLGAWITGIPDAIGPTLLVLAVCLGAFIFVDRAVDAKVDDRAQ